MKFDIRSGWRLAARYALFSTVGLVLLANTFLTLNARAVTLTSQLAFVRSASAPLTGSLIVNTDIPTRISVHVDDGVETWTRHFFDYNTAHSIPMAGFRPDRTNVMTVTLWDKTHEA